MLPRQHNLLHPAPEPHAGEVNAVPTASMSADADTDRRWMDRAVRLALRGVGRVEPNPPVGCVIVDHTTGTVLGEGWHRGYGGPHAEIDALRDLLCRKGLLRPRDAAGAHQPAPAMWQETVDLLRTKQDLLAGATVYVTLEPCNHHGKTPPCAEALGMARPHRIVFGARDPNDVAAGGGARLLAEGIETSLLADHAGARRLIRPFVHMLETGLPWVVVKWAQTVDGRIAARTGHSRWISNAMSRRSVHRMRSRAGAILSGIGTVLADDPTFTPRDLRRGRPSDRPLIRVLIDPDLDLPPDSNLIRTLSTAPLIVATTGLDNPADAANGSGQVLDLQALARDHIDAVPDAISPDGQRRLRLERLARAAAAVGEAAAANLEIVAFCGTGQAGQAGQAGSASSETPVDTGSDRAGMHSGAARAARARTARTAALLEPALRWLARERQVQTVLVEAGGGLVGGLLNQRLANELRVYIAPLLIGDEAAIGPARGVRVETMAGATGLRLERIGRLHEDVELRYTIAR